MRSAIVSSSAASMRATTFSLTAFAIRQVSIRENFFTEQVEILRGPASSYAGRGTAGGAVNIVTKQASDRNFYNAESSFTTDSGKRLTLDVNQVINPTLAVARRRTIPGRRSCRPLTDDR